MESIDCSQVGSDCDDRIFTTSSSTCGSSSVNGPHNPKLNTRAKSLRNFKTINSFRRREKSRTIHHSPIATSDEDSSLEYSPHYMEPTTFSPGKKTVSPGRNKKPSRSLSRTPSFRNSRILIKKGSFETKRGSMSYSKASKDVDVIITRATCSPTLKISIKFHEPAELEEINLAAKVCRDHHCSLHGHCRGAHNTVPRTKRFVYNRRRLLRLKRSLVPIPEPEKRNSDRRKDFRFRESEMISMEELVDRDESGVGEKGLFGLHGRHCSSCSCNKNDNQIPQCGLADVTRRPHEQVVDHIEDKDFPETDIVRCVESTKWNTGFSSSPNSRTPSDINSEGEVDCTTESAPAQEAVHVNDSEKNAPTKEVEQLPFSKPNHFSTWNLIHQRMTSNFALEGECPVEGEKCFPAMESTNSDSKKGNDSENQESELHKMLATKLVREAIEKILLPEIQDQTSDDQSSVSNESTPRAEIFVRNRAEAFGEENCAESNAADKDEGNESSDRKQETQIIDDTYDRQIKKIEQAIVKKPGSKAPKHWSNLKKWILLQRFIRELEKVKKLKPNKVQFIPLNPNPEAEKVNLRPLTAEGRKNSEEWMLDYALRQAVSQLAPTQKRKVALLVRAFETVAPTKVDEHEPAQDQYKVPTLKSDEPVFVENQESGLKETEKPLHLSGNYGESSMKFQENILSNLVEGKTEECGQRNDNIQMWHMIYQHVVSGIAGKVGSQLLDGAEDEEEEEEEVEDEKNHVSSGFNKPDALKLVKEAVHEILLPETQDEMVEKNEVPKAKNWSKLKNLIVLKRSIRALEKARKVEPRAEPAELAIDHGHEALKIDLRHHQMLDEKIKAEQWMLDYAVQHIVTKLTPARKRRVCMLVEAFEAVVPLPEV